MNDSYLSPYTSPFRAGFGVDPPYLAGRDALLHRLLAALADGPGTPSYLSVLIGGRGVGKTVLLNQVREHVAKERGWATVTWSAGPSTSLASKLADEFDHVLANLHDGRSRVAGGSVGVNMGVARAELDVTTRRTSQPATVPGLLLRFGREALDRNRHVVLLVDELQGIEPVDAHALATALQETNAQRLPVALIAAGLPSTPARLRAIPGTTFLERQAVMVVANLSRADARLALDEPLRESGRDFDSAIVPMMLDFAGGYPYALQLVGHAVWLAAGNDPLIDVAAAGRGIAVAAGQLDLMYEGRWAELGEVQRHYLRAVVGLLRPDGSASSSAVAQKLGGSTARFSMARDALISTHQLLYSDARDSLRLALPGLDRWLRTHDDRPLDSGDRRGLDPGPRSGLDL